MKYTVLKCDCCGIEFHSEYYENGYIDHYNNFTERFPILIKRVPKSIADEIVIHNNSFRQAYYLKLRLNCFKKYCEKNEIFDLYIQVEKIVNEHLLHLDKLDQIRKSIKILVADLNETDKKYLGLSYQAY